MRTVVRGQGSPVTVFAHGLGGTIADTRPFGSGVVGTRVFYTARGHDGTHIDRFDYESLADDLREVADAHDATHALGISMGAGALCRLLSQTPDRFERVVLYLPAVIDVPRGAEAMTRLQSLDASTATEAEVADAVLADVPAAVRDTAAARAYAQTRAQVLCLPSMRHAARNLANDVAVTDASALTKVTAPVLILGCVDDVAHPSSVAERLAQLFPNASLHIYDSPDVVWTKRQDLRARVSGFLDD